MLQKLIIILIAFFIPSVSLAEEVANVSIKKFEFIPKEITVTKGTKIRWTNNEKRQYHSVWFEERGDPEGDYFFPDEVYELEFNEIGTFNYRCGPHPKMLGVVTVIEPQNSKVSPQNKVSQERATELAHMVKHDCGSCHGMTLKGGLGPSLLPEQFKDKNIEYIKLSILHGRAGTAMPPWNAILSDSDAQWIAEYLLTGKPAPSN